MDKADLERKVLAAIGNYNDFPIPGVVFKDVLGVLADAEAFAALNQLITAHVLQFRDSIDAVAALDARGFLFGPLVALSLQVPFVAVRKRGKLPGFVSSIKYSTEYSQDELEVQQKYVKKDSNFLVIDDLLATGGTLNAACGLLERAGARVGRCLVIIELSALAGRQRLAGRQVDSLLTL